MLYPAIFQTKKSAIKILILGTYTPSLFAQRLKNLKKCLIEHGFKNTKLVSDFPDHPRFHHTGGPIHFQRKSFYYIKSWAQALLFVYFKDADHTGVTREFSYVVDNVITKTDCSAILRHKALKLSTMIQADILGHRILEYSFRDDKDLCESALGCCRDLTYHLFDVV